MKQNRITQMSDDELLTFLCQLTSDTISAKVRVYISEHLERFRHFLSNIPISSGDSRIFEIGAISNTLPVYTDILDYGFVAMQNKWHSEWLNEQVIKTFADSSKIRIDYYDIEVDPFPYEDNQFDVVVCSEVLEHLSKDPMHMMVEINRILRKNGLLILTTPNITSFLSFYRMLNRKHPYMWSAYDGQSTDRHNREYTVDEIGRLLTDAGFQIVKLETFSRKPIPLKIKLIALWASIPSIIWNGSYVHHKRSGEFVIAVGSKNNLVRDRFPKWLYSKE